MADFDMPGAGSSFEQRGGWVLTHLMTDFGLTQNQAAGIVGNLGGESGLRAINEISPMVPGSRGGFGWAQWTGPRRDAFEGWCQDQDLSPVSDEANYGFLVEELKTTQAHSIVQLKKTTSIEAAVYTFEAIFERPADLEGGLASRVHFAQRAIAGAVGIPAPTGPTTTPVLVPTSPDTSADDLNRQELERIKQGEPDLVPVVTAPAALPPARTAPGVAVATGSGIVTMLAASLQYAGPWNWPLVAPTDSQALAISGLLVALGATGFHLWANSPKGVNGGKS